ncbi:S-adenosyl-L-methionine-dependent methyltransferase [Hypoxylon rubiginosum]|uniref:S-adenosyl-L-methionine-dependent methyltransferase n=1 Tax=Hypoxylon rubiginosum TaxID=110542 RepID=A0ACB9YV38_9PEZI|nr:S-adenosyl-L-methionine-dependent methyltransferase [Hypoxylon rubiginosum]
MAQSPSAKTTVETPPLESDPITAGTSLANTLTPADASDWMQTETDQDAPDDGDSAIGDEAESSTASLSASIQEYRTIHGRRYHSIRGNTDYWGPNDEIQAHSMDLTHHTLTLLFNHKIFLAPIGDDPKKVLDIGCGTGIWATDFADAYPSCEVIGTDISPTQPPWAPPNLRFEMDDFAAVPWTFAPSSFDLVHLRYLLGAVRDWDALCAEAFRALRPGAGWAEAVEPSVFVRSDDGSVREGDGSALAEWGPLFEEAARRYPGSGDGDGGRQQQQQGPCMRVVEEDVLATAFVRAGFVDIVQRTFKCPLSPFPRTAHMREVGMFARFAMEEGMEGFTLYLFTNALGWSREQVTVYLSRVRKELRDRRKSPYLLIQAVYGRKPAAPG